MTKEIYILTHNKINYDINLDNYIPIQVGAELSKEYFYDVRDNIGENISIKNQYYLETTGIYWIYKHSHADIKGQMQYRRFLSINPEFVEPILDKYDIIIAQPLILNGMTIERQYAVNHNIKNLLQIKEILKEFYPEYVESYDNYISNNNVLIYSNSFIAKKETYDKLCEFCFSVLNIFENRYIDTEEKILSYAEETLHTYNENKYIRESYNKNHPNLNYVTYQKRICGYLFERLVTLYVCHNKLNPYICGSYIKFENNEI